MAVLGDRDISRRFDEIFEAGTGDRSKIRAAKYYLTLGNRFLILPDGKRFGGDLTRRPATKPFVLEPGHTALVSTKERLVMPLDLSAIFGPALDLSESGILFFGGMLVDPGFGFRSSSGGWRRSPEPLSFYFANVGSEPFSLRPGEDRIASIAFLKVSDPHVLMDFPSHLETTKAREVRDELFNDPSSDGPDRALGLVEDLRQIRDRVDKFEASTLQVVMFGVIVLAVTLFAAIVSLVVSDPARPVVSSLDLTEVILTVAAVVVELAVLVGAFYVAVAGYAKLRTIRKTRRRKRARKKA